MPTSLATWRSESATRLGRSVRPRAASRIARRVRSLRALRESSTTSPRDSTTPTMRPIVDQRPGPTSHDPAPLAAPARGRPTLVGMDHERLSKGEIRKDAVQDTVEAAATAVGRWPR